MNQKHDLSEMKDLLLREIIQNGITHGAPNKQIVSRSGEVGGAWVMSFLGVGLREPWLSISCDFLLKMLEDFDGRQIATMGHAGSSLLSGCVLRSQQGHNGLFVRAEPKSHGSGNQIEGHADTNEPVIVIDDAIGSGYSALKCVETLEAQGFEVEGVICLVGFSYDSGYALLEEHGLRVKTLFDLYKDIAPIHQPEIIPDAFAHQGQEPLWSNEQAADGIHVFRSIRSNIEAALNAGEIPKPANSFATVLPCDGGLKLSLRRLSDGQPVGRSAIWCFPEEPELTAPEILARASWQLAQSLPRQTDPLSWLDACGLAVTCFSAFEPCLPGEIDKDEFGIICRSTQRPWAMGGALPNMPGIRSSANQIQHALYHNTQLRPLEGFELYRHSATKLIEPGALWPPGGETSPREITPEKADDTARQLFSRVRKVVAQKRISSSNNVFLFDAEKIFISIYDRDQPLACCGCTCSSLADFDALINAAMADPRYASSNDPQVLTFQISILEDSWSEDKVPSFTAGKDALAVITDAGETILLPGVAVEHNLDAEGFIAMLLEKAGVTVDQVQSWRRYAHRSWIMLDNGKLISNQESAWVARKSVLTEMGVDATATHWSSWLKTLIKSGKMAETMFPIENGFGNPANAALQSKLIWRLAESLGMTGREFLSMPVAGDAGQVDVEATSYLLKTNRLSGKEADWSDLSQVLSKAHAALVPRSDVSSYWISLSALAGTKVAEDRGAALIHQIRRRALAPAYLNERVIRLSALCDWQLADERAQLSDFIRKEVDWLSGCLAQSGEFNVPESDTDEMLFTARGAEALAKAFMVLKDVTLTQSCKCCLEFLTKHSIMVADGCAAVRSGKYQSSLKLAHSIVALGAYSAWKETGE